MLDWTDTATILSLSTTSTINEFQILPSVEVMHCTCWNLMHWFLLLIERIHCVSLHDYITHYQNAQIELFQRKILISSSEMKFLALAVVSYSIHDIVNDRISFFIHSLTNVFCHTQWQAILARRNWWLAGSRTQICCQSPNLIFNIWHF